MIKRYRWSCGAILYAQSQAFKKVPKEICSLGNYREDFKQFVSLCLEFVSFWFGSPIQYFLNEKLIIKSKSRLMNAEVVNDKNSGTK